MSLHRHRQMRIALAQSSYQTRPIFGLPLPGVEYRKARFFPWCNRLTGWIPRLEKLSRAMALMVGQDRADLLHSFNRILLNRTPWVISFESTLPRSDFSHPYFPAQIQRRLFSLLARPACRQLIAMSENARIVLHRFNENHPLLGDILPKIRVIYPAFPDFPQWIHHYNVTDRPFHLLFIGAQFFRKGGHIAVQAWEQLPNRRRFQLTVVSSMDEFNYMRRDNPGGAQEWRQRMINSGVRLIEVSLPYPQIRRLISRADLLLLPTLDDSFGFSVVEAMAAGVVPVASAVRALPEIIRGGENGILLESETDEFGRMVQNPKTDRRMVEQLRDRILYWSQRPEELSVLGQTARKDFLRRFTQNRLAGELLQVYQQSLESTHG